MNQFLLYAMNANFLFSESQNCFVSGFQRFGGPTFLPWDSVFYDGTDKPQLFMDPDGVIVTAPYDLRSPFARFVARKGVGSIRRYDIGRVYRQNSASRETHPREVTEAAFDIVTGSTPAEDIIAATAQCLLVLAEIVHRFPTIDSKRCRIRVNHLSLVKAILLYAGVENKEIQLKIMQIWGDSKLERLSRQQKVDRVKDQGVNEHMLKTMLKFLDMDDDLSRVTTALRTITSKRHSQAADLAKMALKECELLAKYLKSAKFSMNLSFAPGFIYNIHQFSPHMIFQLISSPLPCGSRRKGTMLDVLAMGGRYDRLIEKYNKPQLSGNFASISAVGASVAVDKLIWARRGETPEELHICRLTVDVVICSIAGKSGEMLKEKFEICNLLNSCKISAHYIPGPVEDLTSLKDACRKAGAKFLVMLKDSGATCRVRRFNADRLVEKDIQVDVSELIGHIQSDGSAFTADLLEVGRSHASHSFSEAASNSISSVPNSSAHVSAMLNFQFVTSEKLAFNTRKRIEQNISNSLASRLTCFSPKATVNVLALECPGSVIKHIIANSDSTTEASFRGSFGSSIQAFGKYKKILMTVMDAIVDLRFDTKKPSVVVLYSYPDDVYRVMI